MFLFYLVIGALQMFFDDDDDDNKSNNNKYPTTVETLSCSAVKTA